MLQFVVFPQIFGIKQGEGYILLQQDNDSTLHQPLSTKRPKGQISYSLGWTSRKIYVAPAKSTVFARWIFSVGVYKTSLRNNPSSCRVQDRMSRRLAALIASVTWQKPEYRQDVCRATNGAQIEIFWNVCENFISWWTRYDQSNLCIPLLIKILPRTLVRDFRRSGMYGTKDVVVN